MQAMRSAILTRQPSMAQGTFGDLLTDSGLSLKSGELPWHDNATGISCIPPGIYVVKWQWSQAHGKNLYHVVNVPMRSEVEIHAGNLCGDEAAGFASDVLGCMLPGLSVAMFQNGSRVGKHLLTRDQLGVTQSIEALGQLEADMREDNEQKDFMLTIKEAA